MTKREYCLNHEPIAVHDYYRMQIHGFEYGIEDYVYISRLYQPTVCGKTKVMFHKVKINYDADGETYFTITERKYNGKAHKIVLGLNNFIRCGEWAVSAITCKELAAFC